MTEQLPAVLQEIADVVGEAAALAIASRVGGTRIYLPARIYQPERGPDDAHWLVQCIGRDAADKLCQYFAVDGRGQRLEIPLHIGGSYRQLVRAIAEGVHKMDDGTDASSKEIARKFGVTQRTIHRHRRRHRGDKNTKQGKLL